MVNSNRDNCLGHPLVIRFLNEKMNSSSIQKWFLLNILLYTTFLLTLTTYSAIQSGGVHNLKSPGMIALSVVILIVCGFHFIKEILQMVLSKTDYLKDCENYIELIMYICAVIYVVPGGSTKTNGQIAAGAISVFLAWINFSLFLKTFSSYGIYIIMAVRVFQTVCKVLPLVVLFIVAFSLSFSLLMPQDPGFDNIPISLLTTFVMMTGELDYRDTFLASEPLHVMQKLLLVLFILMISIAIMNLFTGLAVGDANEIINQSKEKRRIDKAKLVMKLEKSLHIFPLFSPREIEYNLQDFPDKNLQFSWLSQQWRKVYYDDEVEKPLKAMTDDKKEVNGHQFYDLREEICRTKIANELVREEIEKTNELMRQNAAAMETKIENRLKKIEAMLTQIQVGSVTSSNQNIET